MAIPFRGQGRATGATVIREACDVLRIIPRQPPAVKQQVREKAGGADPA
jgi:hypothetical protein